MQIGEPKVMPPLRYTMHLINNPISEIDMQFLHIPESFPKTLYTEPFGRHEYEQETRAFHLLFPSRLVLN